MSAMTIFLAVFGVLTLAGVLVALIAARRAPEAREDEQGFHFTSPNPPRGRGRRSGKT
jgi:hypothetical protein